MKQIKPLSEIIKWVDVRNRGIVSENLLGINIDKCFMPSVANIIGTDLSNYKLISKNQFACNPMHVGRDEKMPIAIYCDDVPSIVSPAYFVFEVKNSDLIIPDYLMLWFSRAEFDRECWFHTDGSVRGGITWEEIVEMTVPIPPFDEQNAIVEQYKDIERCIELKRQINDNLESQAYAIYKDWFVTNGAINNATECQLGEIISIFDYKRIPLSSQERAERDKIYPYYGAAGLVDYVDNYLFDGIYLLLGEDGSVIDEQGYPFLQYLSGKFWVNNHAHILTGSNGFSTEMIYLTLRKAVIKEFVSGAVQAKLSQENMKSIPAITLSNDKLLKFNNIIQPIFSKIRANQNESYALNSLKSQVLGKLSS